MTLPPADQIRAVMVKAMADGRTLDTRAQLEPAIADILKLSPADRQSKSPNGTSILLNTIDALTGSADRAYGYFETVAPRRYRLSEQGRLAAQGDDPPIVGTTRTRNDSASGDRPDGPQPVISKARAAPPGRSARKTRNSAVSAAIPVDRAELAGALRDLAAAVERMANAVEPREP